MNISGDGTLTVTGGAISNNNNDMSCGIRVNSGLVKILSGTIIASGGTATAYPGGNATYTAGISCEDNTEIWGGSITALGGALGYQSNGIYIKGKLTINSGEVNAVGGNNAYGSNGLYSIYFVINDGTFNASGGIATNYSRGIGWYSLSFNGGATTATTTQDESVTRAAVGVSSSISFGSDVRITQPVGAMVSSQGAFYKYIIATASDSPISVTSAIIAYVDTTGPTAPRVAGTTPTNDNTPTWSWTAGGGGNGTFRYKLDDNDMTSGTTETTNLSFTPGVLADGTHTLYVQERDAAGNWSTSGSYEIVVDITGPTVGSSGTIVSGAVTENTVALSWAAGTDTGTATANLLYKVVYSTSNNIETTAEAISNGVIALDWTSNTTSYTLTGLTASTNYYFNVIVKDQAGNMSAYTTTSTTTTAPTGTSGSSSGTVGGGGSSATPIINTNTGSVTGDQLNTAAGAAKNGETVTINSNKTNEVTFPASGLGSLAGKDNSLTVVTEKGTLTFDSKAVSSMGTQATAEDIKVIVDNVEKVKLTEGQQEKVGDKEVYDLTVMSGGKLISSFNGGRVNVSIPYELKSGQTNDNISVWYMADDGSLTEIKCAYNVATKSVSFVVDHFSKYIIGYDDGATWVNPFKDLMSGAWFYEAVAYVNSRNLMKGQTATTFAPQAAMTRGMFVTILGRMKGVDASIYINTNTFSDVDSSHYYTPYIAWASDKSIVSGVGEDKFAPNASVTREQMAVMMTNYMKYKGQGPVGEWAIQLKYGDLEDVSSWAGEGVMFVTMKGLMKGMGNDISGNQLFAPRLTSNRAQTAQLMMNLQELMK